MAVVGSTDTLLLGDGEKNARAPLAVLLDVVTGTAARLNVFSTRGKMRLTCLFRS